MKFTYLEEGRETEIYEPAPWLKKRVKDISKGIIPLNRVTRVRLIKTNGKIALTVHDKKDNTVAGVMI